MWGIWCFERRDGKGDWLREAQQVRCSGNGVLAFETKRAACARAAEEYGFLDYTETKRKGWCEVRKLT